jgi:hypothetical protein
MVTGDGPRPAGRRRAASGRSADVNDYIRAMVESTNGHAVVRPTSAAHLPPRGRRLPRRPPAVALGRTPSLAATCAWRGTGACFGTQQLLPRSPGLATTYICRGTDACSGIHMLLPRSPALATTCFCRGTGGALSSAGPVVTLSRSGRAPVPPLRSTLARLRRAPPAPLLCWVARTGTSPGEGELVRSGVQAFGRSSDGDWVRTSPGFSGCLLAATRLCTPEPPCEESGRVGRAAGHRHSPFHERTPQQESGTGGARRRPSPLAFPSGTTQQRSGAGGARRRRARVERCTRTRAATRNGRARRRVPPRIAPHPSRGGGRCSRSAGRRGMNARSKHKHS